MVKRTTAAASIDTALTLSLPGHLQDTIEREVNFDAASFVSGNRLGDVFQHLHGLTLRLIQ